MTTQPNDGHYDTLIRAIIEGRLIPFFGAGVNMCGRPEGTEWVITSNFLPNAQELARYFANTYELPFGESTDLARVSQYITVTKGTGSLYEDLHSLLDADYPVTTLHQFFAKLPTILAQVGYPPRHQLIVTTNYDDLMERAFDNCGVAYDVVSYIAEGEGRGKFVHRSPDGDARLIDKPNEYGGISLDQQRSFRRPVILKIHGAVDRAAGGNDSYVITEDDYIEYLIRTDISHLIPVTLAEKLKRSHFLFLGYGLRDWNVRAILYRIWGEQKLKWKSWTVHPDPDPLDQKFWTKRDVEVFSMSLDAYVKGLAERVERLDPKALRKVRT